MKIRFGLGLRLFTVLLTLLVLLAWLFIDKAAEHLKLGARQAVEITLVDLAQLMAAGLEVDYAQHHQFNLQRLADQLQRASHQTVQASIYDYQKTQFDVAVYLTDKRGTVLYDSQGKHTGEDFSQWRDVYLTLSGQYGARISYIDSNDTAEERPKQMVIAAPVRYRDDIIGVLSVVQPTSAYDFFSQDAALTLRYFVLIYLACSLPVVILMTGWLARALGRLSSYAEAMASGLRAQQPQFSDRYFRRLSNSITTLRRELDGKKYVEQYIHGLTHELKTPITNIHAAGEFLQEQDLKPEDYGKFSALILNNSQRLQALIERMLKLAQLESQQQLDQQTPLCLSQLVEEELLHRRLALRTKQIRVNGLPLLSHHVCGDTLLLRQAVGCLLDNAIDFTPQHGEMMIALQCDNSTITLPIDNQGPQIPAYALPRIFERFFSLPRPQGPRSNGLGLSFVAQIMALHQGRITLKNRPDGVQAQLHFPS